MSSSFSNSARLAHGVRARSLSYRNEVEKYGRTADCSLPFVVVDASRVNFSRLHLTIITTLSKLNLSQLEAEPEQAWIDNAYGTTHPVTCLDLSVTTALVDALFLGNDLLQC